MSNSTPSEFSVYRRVLVENEINFFETFQKLFLKYWYLYVVFIGLGLYIARSYLKTSIPVYEINSTLLIQEDKGSLLSGGADFVRNLIGFGSENLANEIQVLSSFTIMDQAVRDLGLKVGAAYKKDNKSSLAYKEFPIIVDTFTLSPSVKASEDFLDGKPIIFEIKPISTERFTLIKDEKSIGTHYFDDDFRNDYGEFRFRLNPNLEPATGVVLQISFTDQTALTNAYLTRFNVDLVNIESTVVKLRLNDEVPERGIALMNRIIDIYNSKTINEKDVITESSLKFLDDRLDNIKDELTRVERKVENYKKSNKISNESAENVEIVMRELNKYTEEQNDLEVQLNIMESLLGFINTPRKFKLIPSNLSVANNEVLFKDISSYNQLVLDREKILQTAELSNPLVDDINQELDKKQLKIRETINNLRGGIKNKLSRIQGFNSKLAKRLDQVPTQERGLLEIRRQFEVKEKLYLFLLQKKEETILSEISRAPNSKIIDEPRYSFQPVAPIKPLVYLGGLLGGLLLPFLFSLGSNLYFDNYLSIKNLKKITDVPIIGIVPRTRKWSKVVVKKDDSSPMAERFRIARANLQYPKQHDKQVISVTSSTEGEGKTFTAINLGLCFALTKQKTIVIDMNLRNPKVADYLGHNGQSAGLTEFINGSIPLSNVIYQYEQEPMLHYITSGQLTLNPHELLMEKNVSKLFFQLIDMYDIIIIDTPAVGAFADAFLLNEFVTKTVYVVKEGKTTKKMLEEADEILHNQVLSNPFLLVNGAKSSSDSVLSYGSVQSGGTTLNGSVNGNGTAPNQQWRKTV